MLEHPLVFLHLSDIHFPVVSGGAAYDLNRDVRASLIRDVAEIRQSVGKPHAILITGDIAFAGKRQEYQIAADWLDTDLCQATDSDASAIWCVPGNHDVDRSIIRDCRTYQLVHEELRSCDPAQIDNRFRPYIKEPEVFYKPIEGYNDFALRYECAISVRQPTWYTDFFLNDSSILRLHGLNSTLISDEQDHLDTAKLILGTHQCQLPQVPGIENVTLCHHPPDWLRDGESVDEILVPRTRIQLYGHKHRHRLRRIGDSLQIAAGALHPDRNGAGWDPRYNWVSIWIDTHNQVRTMQICVYPRLWSRQDQRFVADSNSCQGRDNCQFSFSLAAWQPKTPTTLDSDALVGEESLKLTVPDPAHSASASGGNPVHDPARTLTHRFFSLSYVKKISIASKLNLHADEDADLDEIQRLRMYLARAKKQGTLADLWDLVEQTHGDHKYADNPYRQQPE